MLCSAAVVASTACSSAPPPTPGQCTYSTFEGTCQMIALEDPNHPQVPGQIQARYVTRGNTATGKPDVLLLRYSVEPRHLRMAARHLADNPILRCQVSYVQTGNCAPVVTRLKVPDMPGSPAVGAVQLAPPPQ
ncbi:MAG: hypothetical protein IPK82_31020 [Polyangiaceae bacterium]|nr:hypothetical protein [Polyangiaceae bacterium]